MREMRPHRASLLQISVLDLMSVTLAFANAESGRRYFLDTVIEISLSRVAKLTTRSRQY